MPEATGMVTNRHLFRKLCYQIMSGGTSAFIMLSSDYNVLRSTVIAWNNFLQPKAIVKLCNCFDWRPF